MEKGTVGTTDEMMATLIHTVMKEGVAGASVSATHPDTGGTMMMFFFHRDASEQDMGVLMQEELIMTMRSLDPTYGQPLPPKDPRNMN